MRAGNCRGLMKRSPKPQVLCNARTPRPTQFEGLKQEKREEREEIFQKIPGALRLY